MRNTSLIIKATSLVALTLLLAMQSCTQKAGNSAATNSVAQSSDLKVAYIKIDSLLVNYKLAQDLHDDFTKKQEAYNKEFAGKRQEFEKQAVAFQEKLQRGGFSSQDVAIRERDRLAGQEQEIRKLDNELSTKLAEIQQSNNKQLVDSVDAQLKRYNKKHKFTYILNGANVLIGEESLNITSDVLKIMNDNYAAKK